MDVLNAIGDWCSLGLTVLAFATAFISPVRQKILKLFNQHNANKEIRDGIDKCLLRHQMKEIFKEYKNQPYIEQDDWEDFMSAYASYKLIKGNLFIDNIFKKMWSMSIKFPKDIPDESYFETIEMLRQAGIDVDKLPIHK